MPSSPLDGKNGRTMLGVAYHHRLWAAHTVRLRRALRAIIAFGQHTQSNDVARGMPFSPLGSTHGRTTSSVACHHSPRMANVVEQRQGDMPSPTLDSIHGRTTSGVACHHHLWAAHTVERRRTLHVIIAFRKHTRSDDIGHAMTSPPLDSTHGRMTSGEACHHRLRAAHTVGLHRAWHDITALGQHTRSDDVGRGMPSSPFGSTHGRTTSRVACYHSTWMSNTVE